MQNVFLVFIRTPPEALGANDMGDIDFDCSGDDNNIDMNTMMRLSVFE